MNNDVYPKRWQKPFSEAMSEQQAARVLACPPLHSLNADDFDQSIPLSGIIANDCRIVRFKPGEVIVRKGEYGSWAFLLLTGSASVITGDFEDSGIATKNQGFFHNWFSKSKSLSLFEATASGRGLKISPSFQQFLNEHPTYCIPLEGDIFYGKISALVRGTRQVSFFAETEVEVLEIRWQGLRDLMRFDSRLRNKIQGRYKERELLPLLKNSTLFGHLPIERLTELCRQSIFTNYGEFEWRRGVSATTQGLDSNLEPLIACEQDYVDGLLLVCSGFARLSKKLNHGEKTVAYLKQGDFFGFEELALHWQSGAELSYRHSLRAIGYVDVIRIPTFLVEQYVQPQLGKLPRLTDKRNTFDYGVDADIIEQLIDQRFINGTSAMVIDRHRCTGCDECLNACSNLHRQPPLFSRYGGQIGRYTVAHACMHCTDPVCLIDCPTGAIHRNLQRGDITIDSETCIGCSACANSCPYDNIFMRENLDSHGCVIRDTETGLPVLQAQKCDLCADYGGIPACEQACPHDALKRFDMGNIESVADWFKR